MKRIAVVSTGGTIAGTGKPGKAGQYKAGQLPVDEIISSVPQVQDLAELVVMPVCSVDSNDLSMSDLERLRRTCQELADDDAVDGIVITHGTDTLEETAFLLNLVLDTKKPVVITGAMRPATAVSADGPVNLYQAVALAADSRVADMGVLAVFSNTIYNGRDIQKTNSFKVDAFSNGIGGSIGYMQDDRATLLRLPLNPHTADSAFRRMPVDDLPDVEIFYVHQGSNEKLLDHILANVDGLVIAGTGAGNYPAAFTDHLKGPVPVVRSYRVGQGIVQDSAALDPEQVTIPARDLLPHKARILLQLALKKGMDPRTVFAIY